jgi:NAD(P)-dependent dehydrogenase (short-subunit alcohol dehydrogenase family)
MAFQPQVAIVTGASRGIGRATAIALAGQGVAVALAARNPEDLVAVENRIREIGGRAFTVVADVSDESAVGEMVEETARKLGPVDLLVNNAGVVERSPIVETNLSTWRRVLDVNLTSAFLCTRAALPRMLERARGRIVNVSSISGTLGTPELSAYCASKWGLIGFTKAAAEELRPHNVQVFSVCPGSVNTEMLQKGLPGAIPDMEPEDVAGVIVYLATEAPEAMTGASVDVFG